VLVNEIMSTDLVTVDVDATLRGVTKRLLTASVGSVVVTNDGNPTGLVTESDVLRAAHETGKSLAEVPVRPLCQEPLVSIHPEKSVQHAVREMQAKDVKKLPVVDGIDLEGIITLTDIVYHLSEIKTEARDLAEDHYSWTTE